LKSSVILCGQRLAKKVGLGHEGERGGNNSFFVRVKSLLKEKYEGPETGGGVYAEETRHA